MASQDPSSADFLAPSLEPADTRTTREPDPYESLKRAGWSMKPRMEVSGSGFESLRWSNLRTLISARDEKVAKKMRLDPAAAMRDAWIEALEIVPVPLIVARRSDEPRRVLLLGDTGDGSEAQAAVAQHLVGRAEQPGSQFGCSEVTAVLIESDVVYPAGSVREQKRKFRDVYAGLRSHAPIYAIPGNHDWNDGSLSGFMASFCGATERPKSVDAARGEAAGGLFRRLVLAHWPMWHSGRRRLPPPDVSPGDPPQPGPYVALDVGGVLFIGIDTGYGDTLDPAQARWLVETVEDDAHAHAPKLLFTGKPLIVNGHRAPCPFSRERGVIEEVVGPSGTTYRSVDDVVRRPENGFVAAIGGDTHNYQRYFAHIKPPTESPHVLPYLVSGGGGVFIAQTAWLSYVSLDDTAAPDTIHCDELETVFFPARAHSRLYLDAVIRQSSRRVRLTLPLALVAASLIGLMLCGVQAVLARTGIQIPVPNALACASLAVGALAINIGARPISFGGRLAALIVAAAAGALAANSVRHGVALAEQSLSHDGTRLAVALAPLLGQVLLQLGESATLSATRPRRWLGTTVSALAGLIIIAGSVCALNAAAPNSHTARLVALGVPVAAVVLTALPWLLVKGVSVEEAFDDATRALAGQPPTREHKIRRAGLSWLARNQRRFSVFETFTDGRLTQRTRLKAGPSRSYLPLYRSFLEIEFRRDPGKDAWEFGFTAYGVTGESTRDTTSGTEAPIIVDAFKARWQPNQLEVYP